MDSDRKRKVGREGEKRKCRERKGGRERENWIETKGGKEEERERIGQ